MDVKSKEGRLERLGPANEPTHFRISTVSGMFWYMICVRGKKVGKEPFVFPGKRSSFLIF